VKNKLTSKNQNGDMPLGSFCKEENLASTQNKLLAFSSLLHEVQEFPVMNFCSLYLWGVFSSWMLSAYVSFVICVVYQQSPKIFAEGSGYCCGYIFSKC